MEDLIQMKQNLISCVESQMAGGLEQINAKELGEAVDMIKDLSEAIYYCSITDAMYQPSMPSMSNLYQRYNDFTQQRQRPRGQMMLPYGQDDYYQDNRQQMYYDGNRGGRSGNGGNGGSSSGYYRDPREGRSSIYRKMYMEGKSQNHDKNRQMQELDIYMQELSQDLTEMIQDASMEERQLLQQKISGLASKIK